jgi:hypothetical protein
MLQQIFVKQKKQTNQLTIKKELKPKYDKNKLKSDFIYLLNRFKELSPAKKVQ